MEQKRLITVLNQQAFEQLLKALLHQAFEVVEMGKVNNLN